ncbi:MAG: YgiQ family radical SAM protein, partial [Rikenellaceae bacterium]|nr:YgiQ family radical SAM protein [Rikenellaceae bacterium]
PPIFFFHPPSLIPSWALVAWPGICLKETHATTVYTRILKRLYPDVPVVIGGIEASLRRLSHYDYWQDRIMPSILIDSGADLLSYGLGDKSMPRIARFIADGFNKKRLHTLQQTAYVTDSEGLARLDPEETITLHPYERCLEDKRLLGKNFVHIETQSNIMEPKRLVEETGGRYVVVNAPYPHLDTKEIDRTYDLPFTRLPHPRYRGKGDIPAWEMIKFSVNTHRGCFGGCSFCTISAHQGKFISSRSEESILSEVRTIAGMEGFRGYLSDIGGPSANMYGMKGRNQKACRTCKRPSCLFPKVCPNLDNSHERLMELYRKIDAVPGIKKSFIGSGIRYDLFDDRFGDAYLREVVVNHTSGKLKVAPEHTEDNVLAMMRKPPFTLFENLNKRFVRICEQNGLKYLLVPYFISSHPACRMEDMRRLAAHMKGLNFRLEQVQDFTPTPMTLSSTIFCTGIDPYT